MLKLTGAALVVFASFLYGVILACRKKRRVEYLENTAVRLEKFKSLITLSKIPVTEALNMAAIDPNDAPEGADREKMDLFISSLDSETEEGIVNVTDIFLSEILLSTRPAEEKYEKEAKLLRCGFAALGLLLCIILY